MTFLHMGFCGTFRMSFFLSYFGHYSEKEPACYEFVECLASDLMAPVEIRGVDNVVGRGSGIAI